MKSQWKWQEVELPLRVLLLTVAVAAHASSAHSTFSDPDTEKFLHLAVDEFADRVYVGAVNYIYQLSGALQLLDKVRTAPESSSPPSDSENNYNKLLLIDYEHSRVISCGTLHEGTCFFHDRRNISIYESPSKVPVVATDESASTVGFVSPEDLAIRRPSVLHVATSYAPKGPYLPAVSSRNLNPDATAFFLRAGNMTTGSGLFLKKRVREEFPIKYVYGFSWNGFSYFLTVQKKDTSDDSPFVSKLVRVCQRDPVYKSYAEVELRCRTGTGENYNLAQTANVGKVGPEVAAGLAGNDRALFVVFAKGRRETSRKPRPSSALCVYALKDLQRRFTENIQHCFEGNGQRGLDFIEPSEECQPVGVPITEDFCGMDVNSPLDGSLPIKAVPSLTYPDELLTSVAATAVDNRTIVFLGTDAGHLKRVVLETPSRGVEYSQTLIEEDEAINADMAFSKDGSHLYVMAGNKVFRVSVEQCDEHRTCEECAVSQEPFCGWCTWGNKCTTKSNCDVPPDGSLYWTRHESPQSCRAATAERPRPPPEPRGTIVPNGPTREILIPSGTNKTVTVKLLATYFRVYRSTLDCQFTIEGTTTRVGAKVLADTIYCSKITFQPRSTSPTVSVPFTVLSDHEPLDNPQNLHVVIYRCELMGSDCRSCLELPKKYSCGWCPSSQTCTIQQQCSGHPSTWLYRPRSCAEAPQRVTFRPSVTPSPGTTDKVGSFIGPSVPNECGKLKSCTECLSWSSDCQWCIGRDRCAPIGDAMCRTDYVVTAVSAVTAVGKAQRSCPRVNVAGAIPRETVVPRGAKRALAVTVENVEAFIAARSLLCEFLVEGRPIRVGGRLLGDTVHCDSVTFNYNAPVSNITVPLRVVWQGRKLDNPFNVHVLVYRCDLMAQGCSTCLRLPEKYVCGWCVEDDSCETRDKCYERSTNNFLDRAQQCREMETPL